MSGSPTTFGGESAKPEGPNWDRGATLHLATEGGGVLSGFKSVRHGTFAELIRFVVSMPESKRAGYVIEMDGARRYKTVEIEVLSQRPDFPQGDT